MEQFWRLRREYPVFEYEGYRLDETQDSINIKYFFSIPGLARFSPTWRIPKGRSLGEGERAVLDRLAFSLGMVELVSYWKAACPPKVVVRCGTLSPEQIGWWKKLYYNGLGEFFYINGIEADADDFMEIESKGAERLPAEEAQVSFDGCLIPVGGGKDSSVTMEVLKDLDIPCYAFAINPRGAITETAEAAELGSRILAAKRTIDPALLSLNQRGFLNGHTPFSAIVAFSSVMTAYANGLGFVALSNESSANESSVAGSHVNHQYSKSFEFERDFVRYEAEHIKSGVCYFSFLRPLSEYQITRYFAGKERYHGVFKSCNAGSAQNIWCGRCPKCLFVYVMLSAFLPQGRLEEIFGGDLLENSGLLVYLKQLTGALPEKPFECVGSRDEINTALCETIQRLEEEGLPLPYLLAEYRKSGEFSRFCGRANPYPAFFDAEHLLPARFEQALRRVFFEGEQK